MPVNRNEITKEMVARALQSKSAEELIALAVSLIAPERSSGRPENLLGGKSVQEDGGGRPNHAGAVRDPSFPCHREPYRPCDVQTGILEFVIV